MADYSQGATKRELADPVVYDSHLHTPLCKHASGEPGEYAEEAKRRHLRGIIFTCHGPTPEPYTEDCRMRELFLDHYREMILVARRHWRNLVDVRLGLEIDFVPGWEPWIEALLERFPLDYALGSVHPQFAEYVDTFYAGDVLEFQRLYFRHLGDAAESRLCHALSHPDIVKTMIPAQWQVEAVLDDIRRMLDRVAAAGVALEVNTSCIYKRYPEVSPGPVVLREVSARGIPVVLGSDAHDAYRVGDRFGEILELLADTGFREVSWFIHGVRQSVPIAKAAASLTPESELEDAE